MKRPGPVLVVDNAPAARAGDLGYLAVCVASLENVATLTTRHGSAIAGAAQEACKTRLESLLRAGDQLIPINESKYCLLLKELRDIEHARLAGSALEHLFAEPLEVGALRVRLELRAGMACGIGPDDDAELLFRAAELAREVAVARRRVFELGNPQDIVARVPEWQLADAFAAAVESHAIALHYQPVLGARDGRLLGAEALVRWQHADRLLLPAEFLPQLDASARRVLAAHVIRQCIADLAADATRPPLSVNVPAALLLDPDLARLVGEELALWEVEPARCMLEVSERGLLRHQGELVPVLVGLRALGVRVALDNCAGGPGVLRHYRGLPLDAMKLDRRFVAGDLEDPLDAHAARLQIELAHLLGLEAIAVGVESEVAADRLAAFGCDGLQGFRFAPPLPLAAFDEWRIARR
ncbi:MAG: EAL domain-containing protein [Pseudomonadales bacterium]|nr:EAL domain-containing protein [Pseudomonadales bacterium]